VSGKFFLFSEIYCNARRREVINQGVKRGDFLSPGNSYVQTALRWPSPLKGPSVLPQWGEGGREKSWVLRVGPSFPKKGLREGGGGEAYVFS